MSFPFKERRHFGEVLEGVIQINQEVGGATQKYLNESGSARMIPAQGFPIFNSKLI